MEIMIKVKEKKHKPEFKALEKLYQALRISHRVSCFRNYKVGMKNTSTAQAVASSVAPCFSRMHYRLSGELHLKLPSTMLHHHSGAYTQRSSCQARCRGLFL